MAGWSILEPIHIFMDQLSNRRIPQRLLLGLEEAEADIMNHPPRGKSSNFYQNGVLPSIFYQGFFEGGITLFVFWYATHISLIGEPSWGNNGVCNIRFNPIVPRLQRKSVYKSLGTVSVQEQDV